MPDRFQSLGLNEFRLILDASASGMLIVDDTGRIIFANATVERFFGYQKEQLLGQPVELLLPERFRQNHPTQRDQFMRSPTARPMGHGRDLYGRRSDGTEIPLEIGLNPLRTSAGDFVLASIIDITERRKSQAELLEAKEQLEQRVRDRTKELNQRTAELATLNAELEHARDEAQTGSRLKSEFLANMSHEIRTPMSAVIGMCNLLLRATQDAQQREYAEAIKDGAHALLTVINDILDFSKIEAGKLELELVEFDLVRLVESACELLATAARAKQLSMMSFVDPALPRQVLGDPERIRQILLNLCSNAIKFSDRGEIIVRADLESEHSDRVNVRFSVIDRGIGLSAKEQARLFQPFVQADGSISRRFGGTGLGLSKFDAILMDCQMPIMDGFSATSAIREIEKQSKSRIPIIAMTAHAMSGDRERCLEAGMDDYVSKPVDPDSLRKVLEHWLGASHNPVIDIQKFKEKFGARATEIGQMFVRDTPKELEELAACIETDSFSKASSIAHGLRGVCGTITALVMQQKLADIEEALKSDAPEIGNLINQLWEEFQRVKSVLES